MKIFKRSQLAMLSVAFMIMIAGYINYKYDPEREQQLGQTVKVNGDKIYLYTSNKEVNAYEEVDAAYDDKNESIYETKDEQERIGYV